MSNYYVRVVREDGSTYLISHKGMPITLSEHAARAVLDDMARDALTSEYIRRRRYSMEPCEQTAPAPTTQSPWGL